MRGTRDKKGEKEGATTVGLKGEGITGGVSERSAGLGISPRGHRGGTGTNDCDKGDGGNYNPQPTTPGWGRPQHRKIK